MAKLMGYLTDGVGQAITNTKIILTAIKTTARVTKGASASIGVAEDGYYESDVLPGIYAVRLSKHGEQDDNLGSIHILMDSPDGTLNSFLIKTTEEELTPDVVKEVKTSAGAASLSADQALNAAKKAQVAADSAAAASVSAGLYLTEKEGRDAVKIGQTFSVAGIGKSAITIFKKTSAIKSEVISVVPGTQMLDETKQASEIANSGLMKNFFDELDISTGFQNSIGVLDTSNKNWRTTRYIACQPAQKFIFSGIASSTVGSVCFFDENYIFVAAKAFSSTVKDKEIIAPERAKYVRASAAVTSEMKLYGAILPKIEKLSFIAPEVVHGLVGEPLHLYARGIIGDRSVPVAWNISRSNDEVAIVTPTSETPIPVKLRAVDGDDRPEIAQFRIFATKTPVSPLQPRNIICIGDSVTEGLTGTGIHGAYVNELSRRLTGIGTQITSAETSPTPLNLSNIYFRGTRGDQLIKHEGRGGWNAGDYLTRQSYLNIENAFYNPETKLFDFNYYIKKNQFDIGDGAISTNGDNLTIVILLGWNDVYNTSVSTSSKNLKTMINKIKEARPQADVIIVGLNPAPQVNLKIFDGERFTSDREVFELAIKQYGDAYKKVCDETKAEFLQISHVFMPQVGYAPHSQKYSLRSKDKQIGAADHVHPNVAGMAMVADAVFYKLVYKYFRKSTKVE